MDQLLTIPFELIEHILSFLRKGKDLCAIQQTCASLADLVRKDGCLWKNLLRNSFGSKGVDLPYFLPTECHPKTLPFTANDPESKSSHDLDYKGRYATRCIIWKHNKDHRLYRLGLAAAWNSTHSVLIRTAIKLHSDDSQSALHQALIETSQYSRWSPLSVACTYGNLKLARRLLDEYGPPLVTEKGPWVSGFSISMALVGVVGDAKALKTATLLISALPAIEEAEMAVAIERAARSGYFATLKYLLEHYNTKYKTQDADFLVESRALELACYTGQAQIVSYLLPIITSHQGGHDERTQGYLKDALKHTCDTLDASAVPWRVDVVNQILDHKATDTSRTSILYRVQRNADLRMLWLLWRKDLDQGSRDDCIYFFSWYVFIVLLYAGLGICTLLYLLR